MVLVNKALMLVVMLVRTLMPFSHIRGDISSKKAARTEILLFTSYGGAH